MALSDLPPRLALAHLPTPIHPLDRLSKHLGRQIFVWRDDLTGLHRVRKQDPKTRIPPGRRTRTGRRRRRDVRRPAIEPTRARPVYLARRLGLDVSVVVREPPGGADAYDSWSGNALLDRIAGAPLISPPPR